MAEGGVAAGPLRLGEGAVRDLAHELRLEVVLVAFDLEQVAVRQAGELGLAPTHTRGCQRGYELDRAVGADDRTVLEGRALVGVERVDSCCDEPAEGPRQVTVTVPGGVRLRFRHDRDQLLDEEGVAAAALDHHGDELVVGVGAEECPGELRAGVGLERVEVDEHRVVTPGPWCPAVLELGAVSYTHLTLPTIYSV